MLDHILANIIYQVVEGLMVFFEFFMGIMINWIPFYVLQLFLRFLFLQGGLAEALTAEREACQYLNVLLGNDLKEFEERDKVFLLIPPELGFIKSIEEDRYILFFIL